MWIWYYKCIANVGCDFYNVINAIDIYTGVSSSARGNRNQDGYFVVHNALSDLQRKIELTRTCGYTILGQFELPPAIWWKEYYEPLKKQLEALQGVGSLDKRVKSEIKRAEREINEFDYESNRFGSVFFILKKA